MNFADFATIVNRQFNELAAQNEILYVVDYNNLGKDLYWDTYLNVFPAGTNPIYRQRTEHDCSACRNFIKNVGNVVAIRNGEIHTVWDKVPEEGTYGIVAKRLQEIVRQSEIKEVFYTKESSYGIEKNFERPVNLDTPLVIWHHFWAKIPSKYQRSSPGEAKGSAASRVQVFARGLVTITDYAIDTVLDLIDSNNLYRGKEFKTSILKFKTLIAAYTASKTKHLFAWEHYQQTSADIRNTVVGTLLIDLSEGVPVEQAVASFESKVAPTNYRRPKAVVTNGMIAEATKTIDELGLEPALHRRLAKIEDLNVNDVLWVSSEVANQMKGSIKDILKASVASKPKEGQLIDIQDFLREVAPSTKNMKVYFTQPNNLVTITTSDCDARLFSWNNKFAWSYNGDITDAIKERVKAAGGNINAKLRVSLAWYNYDDLDLSVILPSGENIYFANKKGILDVDMNAGTGETRTPVENLAFKALTYGKYIVGVHNFSQREKKDFGFTLETEYNGKITQYTYNHEVLHREMVRPLEFQVTPDDIIFKENPKLEKYGKSVSKWGLNTQTWVDINTIFLSPNHWEDSNKQGNKHYFFIIKDCKTDDEVRGFYNEFLRSELQQHKRTFELLGSKVKCSPTDNQVSGLGFSETQNNSVLINADGVIYDVKF
jgi:hypothetical protein